MRPSGYDPLITYDLEVPLTLGERLAGRLRRYGPLLPWRACNERGCWNPALPTGGKCELCVERMSGRRVTRVT